MRHRPAPALLHHRVVSDLQQLDHERVRAFDHCLAHHVASRHSAPYRFHALALRLFRSTGLGGAESFMPRPACAARLAALVARCSAAVARAASPRNISAAVALGTFAIARASVSRVHIY
eukprot:31022-Pleurochrysis_carterae.AAC.1